MYFFGFSNKKKVCLIYGGNSNSEELMVWVMGWIEGLPLKKAVEEGYNQQNLLQNLLNNYQTYFNGNF